MISKIINIIFVLTHPSYWIMIHPYNKACEEWCQEALKKPEYTNIGQYRATLSGRTMWNENRPYGFEFEKEGCRPSCHTVKCIYDALEKQIWS